MRVCTKCHEPKPESDFSADRRRRDGLRCWCRTCCNEASRADNRRNRRSILRHGLTLEQYDDIFEAQGKACAFCRTTETGTWCIDHDHACCPGQYSCGRCVRGILCKSCNTFAMAAERYLDRFDELRNYLTSRRR